MEISNCIKILKNEDNFRETYVNLVAYYDLPDQYDRTISGLSYTSQDVSEGNIFFCKGNNFKLSYLNQALEKNISAYITESIDEFPDTTAVGIVVNDVRKAMAVIAANYYDNPQNDITLVTFGGTKGKTTAAYMLKNILDIHTDGKAALISSADIILDGVTKIKASLSTPESLDLFKMLRTAADNGMEYLVMETSSQALKLDRVYGLDYDVAAFLNISPDHIGDIEHPNFEDYFYFKRKMFKQSKTVILNSDSDYYQLLEEAAKDCTEKLITFGNIKSNKECDFIWEKIGGNSFKLTSPFQEYGEFFVNLFGDYNIENAVASISIALQFGVSIKDIKRALNSIVIPGRMEMFKTEDEKLVVIDYAHNYISLKKVLSELKIVFPDKKINVLIGSPGNKAQSRRKDFGKVLSKFADYVVLTEDDSNYEETEKIIKEIEIHLDDGISRKIISNRKEAIKYIISNSSPNSIILLAGKGADKFQKRKGVREFYEGDYQIAKEYVERLKK
jgi:UDP-N-acetylmuramoyl-L-alanyl-D-glutamate--2,6-diaminopimelate ligase